jgi:hypothetical protein
MTLTLFTAADANRLARELAPQLRELMGLRGEIARIESRLAVMPLALAGAAPQNPDAAEARQLIAERKSMAVRIRTGLEAIHSHGCVVKDLEQGLLDFYALAGDRLVFLCWKLGEPEVAHWHPLDGGFAARRPLDRSALEDES